MCLHFSSLSLTPPLPPPSNQPFFFFSCCCRLLLPTGHNNICISPQVKSNISLLLRRLLLARNAAAVAAVLFLLSHCYGSRNSSHLTFQAWSCIQSSWSSQHNSKKLLFDNNLCVIHKKLLFLSHSKTATHLISYPHRWHYFRSCWFSNSLVIFICIINSCCVFSRQSKKSECTLSFPRLTHVRVHELLQHKKRLLLRSPSLLLLFFLSLNLLQCCQTPLPLSTPLLSQRTQNELIVLGRKKSRLSLSLIFSLSFS